MRGLDDLVRQGKVLYLGTSDEPAWVVSYSNALAELRGWTQFTALQVEYSLIERTPERDLLPMAEYLGLGVTAWSPLASGVLTGKYNKDANHQGPKRLDAATFAQVNDRGLAIAAKVKEIADGTGHSPAQIALAWVRQRGAIPIIGARKFSQFEDNLRSLEVILSTEQLAQLDAASKIDLGFPHEFLRREFVHNYLHGGLWDRLEKPSYAG
jgi:aryl-alcohol dehydrogenase-like predicted oxidoreductase